MTTICRRLHRGDDLLLSIKAICRENHIAAGVILSGVGCLTRAVLRDADGVTVRTVEEHCEILSLMGVLDGWRYGVEQNGETGYDEITFERV